MELFSLLNGGNAVHLIFFCLFLKLLLDSLFDPKLKGRNSSKFFLNCLTGGNRNVQFLKKIISFIVTYCL